MSVALGRPLALPILALGAPDQGFATARVTSPFGPRSDGFHAALDIGNYRAGDAVIAAGAGRVVDSGYLTWPWSTPDKRFGTGNTGGRMLVVEHSPGVRSVYAHLGATGAIPPVGAIVGRGATIGRIGDTGSARGAAHLHFAIVAASAAQLVALTRSRKTIPRELCRDPWPIITGARLVDDPTESDDMPTFPAAGLRHTTDRYRARAGARFRAEPSLTAAVLGELAAGEQIPGSLVVAGDVANGSPDWVGAWLYVDGRYRLGFLHVSTLDQVIGPDPTDQLRERIRAELGILDSFVAGAVAKIRGIRQTIG